MLSYYFDLSLYPTYANYELEGFWALDPSISQFSTGGDFTFQGTYGNVWKVFGFLSGVSGSAIVWVKTRDAVERSTMHRTALTAKNYPAQNVNSAAV